MAAGEWHSGGCGAGPLLQLSPGSAAPLLVRGGCSASARGKTWLMPWKKQGRRHPELPPLLPGQIGVVSSRKCDLDHHPLAAGGGREVGAPVSSGDSFLFKLLYLFFCLFAFFSIPSQVSLPLAEGQEPRGHPWFPLP